MKLEDKKKVTVRTYLVRQYGIVIKSYESLIGEYTSREITKEFISGRMPLKQSIWKAAGRPLYGNI